MNNGYGHEVPTPHTPHALRPPARFLVVLNTGDGGVALLCDTDRRPVQEFMAGSEEVTTLTAGLASHTGASGPEWDIALAGHSAEQRAGAAVYLLDA